MGPGSCHDCGGRTPTPRFCFYVAVSPLFPVAATHVAIGPGLQIERASGVAALWSGARPSALPPGGPEGLLHLVRAEQGSHRAAPPPPKSSPSSKAWKGFQKCHKSAVGGYSAQEGLPLLWSLCHFRWALSWEVRPRPWGRKPTQVWSEAGQGPPWATQVTSGRMPPPVCLQLGSQRVRQPCKGLYFMRQICLSFSWIFIVWVGFSFLGNHTWPRPRADYLALCSRDHFWWG